VTGVGNERLTEDLVESQLRRLGYFDSDRVTVEKQRSVSVDIDRALKRASKRGTGNAGYPEFIIRSLDAPDTVILVECKAELNRHESPNRENPVDYAVDGVLHYAKHLSNSFTVISVAVSGSGKNAKWSFFLTPKGTKNDGPLLARGGTEVKALLPMADMLDGICQVK
jgi:type I restriction enzyme M protein